MIYPAITWWIFPVRYVNIYHFLDKHSDVDVTIVDLPTKHLPEGIPWFSPVFLPTPHLPGPPRLGGSPFGSPDAGLVRSRPERDHGLAAVPRKKWGMGGWWFHDGP